MNRLIRQKAWLYIVLYGIVAFFVISFFTKQKVENDDFSMLRWIVLILFLPTLFKYFLQLSLAPWFEFLLWNKKRKQISKRYTPRVSVLIPAWNEEVGILQTLNSVLTSTYRQIEIIIINDGSTDGTHKKVLQFLRKYAKLTSRNKIPVIYKSKTNGGKSRALNYGLKFATGEIVVTIDSDSVIDKEAITNIVKHFRDKKIMCVAGNVKIGNRSKAVGLVQQLEYLYGFYFKKADSIMNSIYIVGGAAAAYRRKVFTRLGNFDEEIITEDIEMSTRIQNAGLKIGYAPDAIVYTEGPTDLGGLFKQRLRWKYGRLLTFAKYRHLFFSLKKKHSPLLTWFILPLALFAELLLFFEPGLLLVFYGYTFYTSDFLPLIVSMCLVALVITLQILTDPKRGENLNLFFLAPVAWCLFYFIDFVEYQALLRSVWKLVKKQEVVWQKWTRVGVFE